jgi:multimeric flavodoxin WrbA
MKQLKVLLVNGSPHEKGCTYTALTEIKSELEKAGVHADIFYIGKDAIHGCIGCGYCKKTGAGKCVNNDGRVNEFIELSKGYDGFVFGSPVHYAAGSAIITAFMDRVFYSGGASFYNKPGAAILSCRRGGATASLDQLNKYFMINRMPIVSSQYWNMVHGNKPEEVLQDAEGMQTMRTLARNMSWLLKCIEAGKEYGVEIPEKEAPVRTNFIR